VVWDRWTASVLVAQNRLQLFLYYLVCRGGRVGVDDDGDTTRDFTTI
jgi:hypothetical protein